MSPLTRGPGPGRHGRRQRHARLVLRRRRVRSTRDAAIAHGRRARRPRARRSSTSAASRRGPGAEPVPAERGAARASSRWSRGCAAPARGSRSTRSKLAVAARGARRRRDATSTTSPRCAATPSWPRSSPSAASTAASCTCSASRARCSATRATTTSSTTSRRSWPSALEFAVAAGRRRGADPARPRDRLRQDGRAQPRAARAACDELVRARPADRDRHVAQVVPRPITGRDVTERVAGDDRHERARARARRDACSASTTSAAVARRAGGRGCYVARAMDARRVRRRRRRRRPDDDDDDDEDGPEIGVTVEIIGLSLYTHHGVTAAEREIGQRLLLDVRFDVGEPDATDHRPRRGHRRLRRGLPGRRADRPAALLPDARAAVRGDRRPPPRRSSAPRA